MFIQKQTKKSTEPTLLLIFHVFIDNLLDFSFLNFVLKYD